MIGRSAEACLLPDLLAEGFGETLFEVVDVGFLAADAVGEVRDVREERLLARAGTDGSAGRRFGGGVCGDGRVQVRVPVDEAAVHSGGP